MKRKSIAAEYIELHSLWSETSKETIANNVIKHIKEKFPECKTSAAQQILIAEITKSTKHAVYAWINPSRDHVKIPLLKLCMIADEIDIDVYKLFEEGKENG